MKYARLILYKMRHYSVSSYLFTNMCKIGGMKTWSEIPFSAKLTWPHKVSIGRNCVFEHDIYFKHDGPYSTGKSIIIGDHVFIGAGCEFNVRKLITISANCLIASGCRFVDHDHGTDKNFLMREQQGAEKEIFIDEDVWIGANAVVLKGVHIGKGAIVAAGAVVTKSIPAYEVWGGVPAKKLSERN